MTWQYQVEALADEIILEDIFGVLLLVEVCKLKMHLVCGTTFHLLAQLLTVNNHALL